MFFPLPCYFQIFCHVSMQVFGWGWNFQLFNQILSLLVTCPILRQSKDPDLSLLTRYKFRYNGWGWVWVTKDISVVQQSKKDQICIFMCQEREEVCTEGQVSPRSNGSHKSPSGELWNLNGPSELASPNMLRLSSLTFVICTRKLPALGWSSSY